MNQPTSEERLEPTLDRVRDVTLFDPFLQIVPGDFDGNGEVEGADLLQWEGDFSANGMSDGDGDGDSDGADFLVWQRNYESASVVATVPEPVNLALVCWLAVWRLWPRRAS